MYEDDDYNYAAKAKEVTKFIITSKYRLNYPIRSELSKTEIPAYLQ